MTPLSPQNLNLKRWTPSTKTVPQAPLLNTHARSLSRPENSEMYESQNSPPKALALPRPVPKVNTDAENQAIQSFIERNMAGKKNFRQITDNKEWRKKNRVEKGQCVFIINGPYKDVRKALLRRGWFENEDKESPCFDLKWTLKTKDVRADELKDYQIVNHFAKSACFTTKAGLTQSLKNLVHFSPVDVNSFYPRCYDLRDDGEMEDFMYDFKLVKA